MNSEEHFGPRNTKYFMDTYALIEILKGNANYSRFIDKPFLTTNLNLFELHSYLLKSRGESIADELIEDYIKNVVEFDIQIIKKASKFRNAQNKRNLSAADCIGYSFSKENGFLFITGDKEFKDLPNVEFVR